MAKYDPLDRRQRLAATILMIAVDLPQPAADFAKLSMLAAKLTPGVTLDEAPWNGRRAGLLRARALIDAMLEEDDVKALGEVAGTPVPILVAAMGGEAREFDSAAVHRHHCNQGEYEGACKYGEDDTCPVLKPNGGT